MLHTQQNKVILKIHKNKALDTYKKIKNMKMKLVWYTYISKSYYVRGSGVVLDFTLYFEMPEKISTTVHLIFMQSQFLNFAFTLDITYLDFETGNV